MNYLKKYGENVPTSYISCLGFWKENGLYLISDIIQIVLLTIGMKVVPIVCLLPPSHRQYRDVIYIILRLFDGMAVTNMKLLLGFYMYGKQ
jgi:hypothetical protein